MKQLERLRQLGAKYWQPLVTVITGIFSFSGVWTGWENFSQGHSTLAPWLVAGFSIFGFIIIRFPGVAARITRLLLGQPPPIFNPPSLFRGPQAYGSKDELPGRQADIDRCWKALQQKLFSILEGESGCGKSSLLNAKLIPKAREQFRIDQFEELFVTVKDDVRSQFLTVLKEAIKDGKLRLIVAIWSDFRDLLDKLCRIVDAEQEVLNLGNYHPLRAFLQDQAEAVLGEILQPVSGDDPLLKQQTEDFSKALVRELLESSNELHCLLL